MVGFKPRELPTALRVDWFWLIVVDIVFQHDLFSVPFSRDCQIQDAASRGIFVRAGSMGRAFSLLLLRPGNSA
jgi:hypothetical protein